MTADSAQAITRITSPSQIAAALPHLLGFHPRESLVVLWMAEDTLVVAQRADLEPTMASRDFVDAFLAPTAHIAATCAVAIVVTADGESTRGLEIELRRRCRVSLRSVLVVQGSRVRESSRQGECGPWIWISAADRTWARENFPGTEPQPHRAAIVREMAPNVPPNVPPKEVAAGGRGESPKSGEIHAPGFTAGAIETLVRMFSGHPAGWRSSLVGDGAACVAGRDLVVWWAARLRGSERERLLELLIEALGRTPQGKAAEIAAATGVVAWLCGDGVRANAALDRCLAEDRRNSLGMMLDAVIAAGVPPHSVESMLLEIDAETAGIPEGLMDVETGRRYSPA